MLNKLKRSKDKFQLPGPVKVLQFGEGNFLRAFADWMIDLMNEKGVFSGTVQIVQPIPSGMGEQLNRQDGLYHVLLNGISKGKLIRENRLITCVKEVINPYTNYDQFLATADNPDISIILSNTTEAGIAFEPSDRDFLSTPSAFPGKLTAWLLRRYQTFKGDPSKAVTLLPCELIEKNGAALREKILAYAAHWNLGPGFTEWVSSYILFCNTLVDRIVPGFPKENAQSLWNELGYEDPMLVTAEPFHLWVIEPIPNKSSDIEGFRNQFPLEDAGMQVKITDDLTPYRTRKVRILNGAHTAMVPVAYLAGLRTVKEAVDDPRIGEFIRKTIYDEIIPTLDLSQEELEQFAGDVFERFQNPYVRHELMSIALNSISKFQVRVLPSLLAYVRLKGELPNNLVHALAALILFYRGEWNGEKIAINDTATVRSIFDEAWMFREHKVVAKVILSKTELWDVDLTKIPTLEEEVARHMDALTESVIYK